jgi:hypothetical protein
MPAVETIKSIDSMKKIDLRIGSLLLINGCWNVNTRLTRLYANEDHCDHHAMFLLREIFIKNMDNFAVSVC